jgi:hypothetical protein
MTEEQARKNASRMYNIQQKAFEEGRWAERLEEQFMNGANLCYHIPPQQKKNRSGCIEKLINQQRINQTKIMNERAKKHSHGLFITIKGKAGLGRGQQRRKVGVYGDWMLHKYDGKVGKKVSSRGSGSTVSLVEFKCIRYNVYY